MKQCSTCKIIKPLKFFSRRKDQYTKDGYRGQCKDCKYHCVKKWINSPQGREKFRKIQKRYRQTKKGKYSISKGSKKYYWQHKRKRTAKMVVWNAIETKKIPKISTQKCSQCYTQAHHYHHHKGYAKKHRLDVIPLCRFCHVKAHRVPPIKDPL